ncbi:hypothetical protein BH10BAC5_BH10BAC5_12120 [soil metagenome]
MKPTLEQIENVLTKVRPYLQMDGGDVEAVNVTDDYVIEVRLLGACNGCPISQMTLRAGIERAIMSEFPEVKRVENIA